MGHVGHFALTQISLVTLTRGTDRMATLPKFTHHSSHKADDDFLHSSEALKAWIRLLYKYWGWYKLGGGAVVEELCYTINGDSLQIRRKGDDIITIF